MASNAINNPRIDRAFINPGTGALTEYGYQVIARIIERVGGPVGDILDDSSLQGVVLAPLPHDFSGEVAALQRSIDLLPSAVAAPQQAPSIEAQHSALLAIVDTLHKRLHALEIAT